MAGYPAALCGRATSVDDLLSEGISIRPLSAHQA